MQTLKHIMDGELDKARAVLQSIPDVERPEALETIAAGAVTLSEMARNLRGNRAERRARARSTGRPHRPTRRGA